MVDGQKLLGQHPASNYVFLLTQVVLLLDHVESSQAQSDWNIIEYPKPQGQPVIFLLTTLLRRNLLWENGGNLFLAPYSPGILSSKVGQPATNCKRIFLNGFWPRNMSSVTYQKSPKIRAGDVDKKQVFLEPYTAQHGNEAVCTVCCVA